MYHHEPPRHARAAWSRYDNRLSPIWCRRLRCACQQPFFLARCCLGQVANKLPLTKIRRLHLMFFFLIAGCNGSLGYWQSLATRESNKQHQWYCVPKESQVPIHYDLSHHNLCMTERMVHKREKRHNNTRKTKARKHQPTTKTNTHNQTQNHRQHRGET